MKSLWFILICALLASCGGGDSAPTPMDIPDATSGIISPVDGATLNANSQLVVAFNGPMSANSQVLGGTLDAGVNIVWSTQTYANDTLTIIPNSTWTDGLARTLSIDANNAAGVPVDTINVTYDVDAVTPGADVVPASGSTMLNTGQIVITFNEAMNNNVTLTGNMVAESDEGVWTTTTYNNDTLTFTPKTSWTIGSNRTLDVEVTDAAGNPLTLNLAYQVVSRLINVTFLPANGSIIPADQAITLVFDTTMNPATLILDGNLSGESNGGIWSSTNLPNDTLTIQPDTAWTTAANLNAAGPEISIEVADMDGNTVTQFRDYEVNVVFVSTTGNNNDPGSAAKPKNTIQAAVTAANALGVTQVYVQAGNYNNGVLDMLNGVNIQGGYNSNWVYSNSLLDPQHVVNLYGASIDGQYMTVRAQDVSSPTVLSTMIINGPNVAATSASGAPPLSSYAIYSLNSSALSLSDLRIVGGTGGDSGRGLNGSDDVSTAPGGTQGSSAQELNTVCNSTTRRAGGPGGGIGARAGGDGGAGGTVDTSCSGFPNLASGSGLNGSSAAIVTGTFGYRGSGGISDCSGGNRGNDGRNGDPGGAGNGGTEGGNIVNNVWIPFTGQSGNFGNDGTGGGGGGGAAGCDTGIDDLGAGGGGGGAGGLGNTSPGSGGYGGGASIGVFMLNSTVTVGNTEFVRGNGGNGGPGGNGGFGQHGGSGGPGGPIGASDGNPGGDGGKGGDGGRAGGGGGGAGGNSYSVLKNTNSQLIVQTGVIHSGGGAGSAGIGGNNANISSRGGNGVVLGIVTK